MQVQNDKYHDWNNFRELVFSLRSKVPPLKMESQLYMAACLMRLRHGPWRQMLIHGWLSGWLLYSWEKDRQAQNCEHGQVLGWSFTDVMRRCKPWNVRVIHVSCWWRSGLLLSKKIGIMHHPLAGNLPSGHPERQMLSQQCLECGCVRWSRRLWWLWIRTSAVFNIVMVELNSKC